MRKGNDPKMLVDGKGRLFAIATGADATSEHECGSKPLMLGLTGHAQQTREEVAAAMKQPKGFVKSLLNTSLPMPDLMAMRRIVRDLDSIAYEEAVRDGQQVAVLTYSARGRDDKPFDNAELRFSEYGQHDHDIAGAWDESSFGFKVRGAKKVAQLRAFANAIKTGKGMFAGTFLKEGDNERLSGVILAVEALLRPEHRQAMKQAQTEFEGDVRLHVAASTHELRALAQKHLGGGRYITYIWPIWRDRVVDSEVAYQVNPGSGIDSSVCGPYSFDELSAWLIAGAKGPVKRTGTSSAIPA